MKRLSGLAVAALAGVAAVAAAFACAAWPLSVYAVTLAAFGVPHALVELRWVGRRYGGRRPEAARVVAVLALIALARLAALLLGLAPAASAALELGLGMLLVACVLPRDLRRPRGRVVATGAVLALLAYGAAAAPVDALLVLAVLHNLTPVGFVADRLRDGDAPSRERARFATAGLLTCLVVPAWLASGAAASLLGLPSAGSTAGDLATAGGLGLALFDGIGAFRPSFVPAARALDLLRAAAFLQVVHYVAVLLVLPRLGPHAGARRRAPWPHLQRAFGVLVAFLAVVFTTAFAVDFRQARAAYGVLAAVHVWLEFPALLLAFAGPRVAMVPA